MTINLPTNLEIEPGKTYVAKGFEIKNGAINIIADEIEANKFPDTAQNIFMEAIDTEGILLLASQLLDGMACKQPTFIQFFQGLSGIHYKLV